MGVDGRQPVIEGWRVGVELVDNIDDFIKGVVIALAVAGVPVHCGFLVAFLLN